MYMLLLKLQKVIGICGSKYCTFQSHSAAVILKPYSMDYFGNIVLCSLMWINTYLTISGHKLKVHINLNLCQNKLVNLWNVSMITLTTEGGRPYLSSTSAFKFGTVLGSPKFQVMLCILIVKHFVASNLENAAIIHKCMKT